MKIKITIKEGSKFEEYIKDHLKEKQDWKNAILNNKVDEYIKSTKK